MLVNLNIRLSSVKENMNRVEEFIGNIMISFGISDFYQAKIALAVEEAAMNAITFGNHEDSNKFITVEFNYNNEYFDFAISDEGEGFNHTNITNPIESKNEDEGKGLFLMRTLSDELIFNNTGSKATLRFYNNIRSIA
ncbi:MAG: ATP-binding protein [Marinifilaceae bacterium]